jgi:NRPS condensation-like uncharacterized protein
MREIGFIESLPLFVEKENITANCMLRARFKGVSLDRLIPAVERCRKAQPLFCAIPEENHFRITEKTIPTVQYNHGSAWIPIAEAELDLPIPRDKPLVKQIFIQGDGWVDFLFKFHHAVGDGISAVHFLRDILRALNNHPPHKRSIPPSIDSVMPNLGLRGVISGGRILSGAIRDLIQKPYMLNDVSEQGEKESGASKKLVSKTKIVFETLTEDVSQNILRLSRKKKTTVHGTVLAAVLWAIHHKKGGQTSRINIASPINMRDEVAIQDQAGLYISIITTRHLVNNSDDFWETARNARHALIQSLNNKEHYLSIKLPTLLGKAEEASEKFTSFYRFAALVTNIGRLDSLLPNNNRIDVDGICAVPSVSMLSRNELGVAINSFRGKMNLSFIYIEGIIEPEDIIKDVINILSNLS